MAQPARRKSGLDGMSPAKPQPLASMVMESAAVAAPAASALAPVQVTAPQVAPAQEVAAPTAVEQQAAPAAPVKKGKTPKTSFYQGHDDGMRMRGAFLATKYEEGHENLSEFINEAVMDKVRALEEKHNGGQPFRPLPPGGIGLGKPVKI